MSDVTASQVRVLMHVASETSAESLLAENRATPIASNDSSSLLPSLLPPQCQTVAREFLIREPRQKSAHYRIVAHLRILRIFAMYAFAAALPFTNLAGFDFRGVDRELDDFERRRFRVPFDRAFDELEPFFF